MKSTDPDIELEAMFWLRDHPIKPQKNKVNSPWKKTPWQKQAGNLLKKIACGAAINWLLTWLLVQGHITDTAASAGMIAVLACMAFILGKDFPWKEANW